MTWATDRRLDYIDWRLLTAGAIRRSDIMRAFEVSEGQASADLAEFHRLYPEASRYDKSAKRYVPANGRYGSQRGIKRRVPLVFEIVN
jgi:hypothetical protein